MRAPFRRLAILVSFVTWISSALGAIVTVQFAGRVTGSDLGSRTGSWMTGCFTYDTSAPDRIQSSTHPIFVLSVPEEHSELLFTVYALSVIDNTFSDPNTYDGIFLEFSYPLGFASLMLRSLDTTLFTGPSLPERIPPIEKFEPAPRAIYITQEAPPPYRTTTMSVEILVNLPTEPIDVRMTFQEKIGTEIRFQFTGDPTSNYEVESTDSLSSPNWSKVKWDPLESTCRHASLSIL